MTIISSVASAFGVPNPISALASAVQQAGAKANPPAGAAAQSAAPTDAAITTGSNQARVPHHHHHHGGSAVAAPATTGGTATTGAIGTPSAGTGMPSTGPVATFVSTLESALATLGVSESGAKGAGSGATTTLYS